MMKHLNLFFSFILIALPLLGSCQNEAKDLNRTVKHVLADYTPGSINKEEASLIQEAFRESGLRGGPELDQAIARAGFNPELIKGTPPPRSGDNDSHEHPKDKPQERIFTPLEKDYPASGFVLHSPAVNGEGELLPEFKGEKKVEGKENSLPLSWENVPEGAESLAIVMYHYPNREDHLYVNSYLLLWGIDPSVKEIPYGQADKGSWFMGSNKDGNAISYTSPNSHGPGVHEYTIALFALAETPGDLPLESSVNVNFSTFMTAIEKSTIIGKTELNFTDKKE
jgi:phosphatidylethanolamine-binding protein (PEBP) family uncharacterized protein